MTVRWKEEPEGQGITKGILLLRVGLLCQQRLHDLNMALRTTHIYTNTDTHIHTHARTRTLALVRHTRTRASQSQGDVETPPRAGCAGKTSPRQSQGRTLSAARISAVKPCAFAALTSTTGRRNRHLTESRCPHSEAMMSGVPPLLLRVDTYTHTHAYAHTMTHTHTREHSRPHTHTFYQTRTHTVHDRR